MKKIISVMAISLALVSCVTTPDRAEMAAANFGNLPDGYQEIVRNEILQRLKDPQSAQFEFATPYKAWCKSGFTTFYGWLVPLTVNAKNSYGGYVGRKPMAYLISEGIARDFTSPFQVGGCGKA